MVEPRMDAVNPDVHHETTDVNIRGVLVFGAGMIVAAAFIYFAVWILFRLLADQHAQRGVPEYPLAATQERRVPPEPRLQPSPPGWRTPREDLRDFRKQEDEILSTYGWTDKSAGTVRIPIDEAMKLTVQRGLPARQDRK
jgi:hypothetical protein